MNKEIFCSFTEEGPIIYPKVIQQIFFTEVRLIMYRRIIQ